MDKLNISVVVPLYNEAESLPELAAWIDRVMRENGFSYELILIDDGSSDGSWEEVERLKTQYPAIRGIGFARNYGKSAALYCGFAAAEGEVVITMDADLQDPPEVAMEMIAKWKEGFDVVHGKRRKRKGETVFKKLTAFCYYRLLNAMSAYPIPLDTGDFRLLDKKVADVFLKMREHNRFLRGMSGWMGFDAVPVEYVRHERQAGKTKYTLKKMLRLAFDGILGFSYKPMSLALYAGAALGVTGMLGLIALIIIAATIGCAPWLWAVDGLVLINALTLAAIGVQGAYLNRIYDEVRGRPLYIAAETINLDR